LDERRFAPRECGKARQPWAFTRLELLVTAGVVVLLAAVGGALAKRLRERPGELTCLSNMKTVVAAFERYAGDHGSYPWAAREGQPVPEDWVHWQPTRKLEQSAVAAYQRPQGGAPLTCPGDADSRYRVYPFSYTMNAHIEKLVPGRIVNKGQMVLLYEEKYPNDGACAPGETVDALTRRHQGRSHAAFGDGHAEAVREKYATEWGRCRPVVKEAE